jgi:peroxiredoxin
MAQLRDASEDYTKSDTQVLIVAPDSAEAFQKMWREEAIPFIRLPDPTHSVLKDF